MTSQAIEDALERQGRIDPVLASIGKLEERLLALEHRISNFEPADKLRPAETPQQRYDAARHAVTELLAAPSVGTWIAYTDRVQTAVDGLAQAAHDLGFEEGYAKGRYDREDRR